MIRAEIGEEIQAHFEGTIELLMDRGMGREEARAEVARRFGDVDRYRDRMERMARRRVRRRRRMEWLHGVRSGVWFTIRSVRRSPGFAAAVTLTLTLGIGANALVFGAVDRLLLRAPDHVASPDDVRRLYIRGRSDRGEGSPVTTSSSMTYPDVEAFRGLDVFGSVGTWVRFGDLTLGEGSSAERVLVHGASADLFRTLGVQPRIGRFFGPDDDTPEATPTAVLAHAFWSRRYGRDPGVVGSTIQLGDGRYQVVGVAPRGFTGAVLEPVDVWVALEPAAMTEWGDSWVDNPGWWAFGAVARLEAGSTDQVARDQATAAHLGTRENVERYDPTADVMLAPIITGQGPDAPAEAGVTRWLAGVSVLVLLIACFNVANLFMGRAVRWRRELAVRLALGSSRARLTMQFVAEALVLALIAAGVAAAVSLVGGRLLLGMLLPQVGFDSGAGDGRIVVFTLMAATGAALLSSLVPAFRAGRTNLQVTLKEGGVGGQRRSSSRPRFALVAGQAALTAVLLVGAGLFTASLNAARSTDLGFDPDRVAMIRFERGSEQDERTAEVYRRIEQALPRLPGVESASMATGVPFGQSFGREIFAPAADTALRNPDGTLAGLSGVGSDYFRTMGMTVLRGRVIEPADLADEAEPVALVNRRMAETVFPGRDPIGECLRVGGPGADCVRIVGIVEDHAWDEIDEEPRMHAFVTVGPGGMNFVWAVMIRTQGDPADQVEAVRAEVRSVAPEARYVEYQPIDELVGTRLRAWRLGARLFGVFGLLAVLVAGVGMYSVLTFEVAQRRHELGIRMALGAPVGRVLRHVILGGTGTVVLGAAVGLALAALAAPRIAPLLFQTAPRDPAVFAAAAGVLVIVGLLASLTPAWRATRVAPTEAMRDR